MSIMETEAADGTVAVSQNQALLTKGLIKSKWRRIAAVSVSLWALNYAATPLACAQEESANAPQDEFTIQTIVVTARKRSENLQETPIAITVFSSDQIERAGLDDLTDLSRFAPNVVFDQGTGNTGSSNNAQAFIRGVGQTDFLFTVDPGVGIYIDEVYLPRVTGSILDLIDIERIEVLRGPQGSLFGKNTIGGAVSIVSQSPENEFNGAASIEIGSRDRLDARLSLNVPMIDDTLAFRISGSSRNQDGYVERVLEPGRATGDVNSDAIRGQLLWTPDNAWEVTVTGDYTRGREEAIAGELIAVEPTAALLGLWNALVAPALGQGIYDDSFVSAELESQATGPSFSDIDAWGVSLKVSGELTDNVSIKSITAFRETDAAFGMDQDHSPLPFAESTNINEHEQFSQELQLSGTGFDERLDWVAGVFYMNEQASDVYDLTIAGGLFNALEALPLPLIPLAAGVTCPPPSGMVLPCAGGAGNPINASLDFEASIFNDIDIDSYAIFGQGTFEASDKLSFTAGGRYSRDEKALTAMLVRNASGLVSVPETTIEDAWEAFTPRASLEYQWNPDLLTYVSVSRGFKSGGFNGRAQSVAEIDSFEPETVWTYEAGLKAQLAGGRLMLNLAAFHNEYRDIQLTSIREVGGLLVAVTENAGEAKITGFEAEFIARPTKDLSLRGGLGYLDARFTQLDPGATVTLDSEFVKTPDWTANLVVDHAFDMGDAGALNIGGDLSFRSSHANETTNIPLLQQDAFALLGAYIKYTSANEKWTLTFHGRNLTDARYITNGVNAMDSVGTVDATFGRPREWALNLSAKF